jgi:hypothetical protein
MPRNVFELISLATVESRPKAHKTTPDHLTLARAVRRQFHKPHPDYVATICWRYLELYRMPLSEALHCVRLGYSSPSAAMVDRVTKHRDQHPRSIGKERAAPAARE